MILSQKKSNEGRQMKIQIFGVLCVLMLVQQSALAANSGSSYQTFHTDRFSLSLDTSSKKPSLLLKRSAMSKASLRPQSFAAAATTSCPNSGRVVLADFGVNIEVGTSTDLDLFVLTDSAPVTSSFAGLSVVL